MGITARNGAVLQISVNEATLVPYVVNTLRDSALAIQLAARLSLPGADDLYMSEFNRMLGSNDVAAAARLAGESPNGEGSGRGRGRGGAERRADREREREREMGRERGGRGEETMRGTRETKRDTDARPQRGGKRGDNKGAPCPRETT